MERRLMLASVLLLAGMMVMLGPATRSGSPASIDPVAQAATASTRAGGAQMSLTGSISAPGAMARISFSGQGHFNLPAQEGELRLKLGGLPRSGAAALAGGSLAITELFKGGSVYLASPLLEGRLPGRARWMRLGLGKLAGASGLDPSSLTSGGADPGLYLSYLASAGTTSSILAHESVRGVLTTRYAGELDLVRGARAGQRASGVGVLGALARLAGQTGLRSVPVEVWVDRQDLIRRVSLGLTVATHGQRLRMGVTAEYFDFGAGASVTAPSGSKVLDLTAR